MKKNSLNISFDKPQKSDHYVTGLIKYICDEFDQEGVANNLVKRYYNDASSKYYQKSANDIINEWKATGDRSIFIGNALDNYVGLVTEPENQQQTLAEWSASVNFSNDPDIYNRTFAWDNYWKTLEENGWEMVGREVPLYMTINGRTVGGRADMILYNPRFDTIMIIDWKTTNNIKKDRFTKPAHGPISGLYQDKETLYGLQTVFYKIALVDKLPEKYKNSNICTCIVQVCSDGKIIQTKNNITLSNEDVIKLFAWCISEDLKKTGTIDIKEDNKETNKEEFCKDIASIINKYNIDGLCNVPDFVLAKYILSSIENIKELQESLKQFYK